MKGGTCRHTPGRLGRCGGVDVGLKCPSPDQVEDGRVVEMRLARARSRRLMICTPVHGDEKPQYGVGLYNTAIMCERMGIRHILQQVRGSSNLPRSRNELCAYFLSSECTDLLFIDCDMGWKANSVLRLLASDQGVIAGVGRRKMDEVSWCVRLLPGSEKSLNHDAMGAIEVSGVGTGFMRITREALEAIVAARPDLKLKANRQLEEACHPHYYRFFRFGEDDGGEDYEFCDLHRSVGGSVWVDPTIELVHVGDKEYRGRLEEALSVDLPAGA